MPKAYAIVVCAPIEYTRTLATSLLSTLNGRFVMRLYHLQYQLIGASKHSTVTSADAKTIEDSRERCEVVWRSL
jgi:hypothetical protein